MRQTEVIIRFCELATQVGTEVFGNHVSHDCFCSFQSERMALTFQFNDQIMAFIEEAVRNAIKEDKIVRGV